MNRDSQDPHGPHGGTKLVPCVIYTRVSTDEQAKEEHYSLEAQEEYCLGEIKKRQALGWFYKMTISDAGYSGSTYDRPGLLRVIAMAKAGEIGAVAVYKRERLFRNADIAAQVQAIFDMHGVLVLSYIEGLHDTSPHSVLMRQFIDANAQFERANSRMRVQDCMRFAAKRGDWKGGIPSFGYSYEPGSKTLTRLPSEQEIVVIIFKRISEGTPAIDLVNEFRKNGIRNRPSRMHKDGGGNPRQVFFTLNSVRAIVRNPVYRGIVRVRKAHGDFMPRGKNSTEWEEFRGRHVPLVTDELWFAANRVLDFQEPKERHRRILPRGTVVGLLQGVLRCGCCNASMSPGHAQRSKRSGERHRYYRCSHFAKGGQESKCTTRQISSDAVETALASLIGAIDTNPETFARCGLEITSRKREEDIARAREELRTVELQLAEQKRSVENLLRFVKESRTEALAPDALEAAEDAKAEIAKLEYRRIDAELALNKLALKTPSLIELSKAFGAVARALALANFVAKAGIFRDVLREVRLSRVGPRTGDRAVGKMSRRTFRLVAKFRTNDLMNFGNAEPNLMALRTRYSDVELSTTFEVRSSAKEQSICLLEHGFSVVSAVFVPMRDHTEVHTFHAGENPIQRAMRWKALLDGHGKTAAQLASEQRVSRGLISQYTALLRLPAVVVEFLKDGRDRGLKQGFTFRELQRLAEMPADEAVRRFHARVAGLAVQEVMRLEG